MKQGAKCWSQSVGRYRARIRVYESRPGGNLYAEIAERGPGARKHHYRQFSLRHRDRDRAVQWAQDQVTLMLLGQPNVADPPPTVWRLIQAYLTHVKPQHKPAGQRNDIRAGNLWLAVLGKDTDLRLITLARWTTFIRDRRAGAIDAEGVPVPTLEDRRAVGAAAVASDLLWLRAVINFGTKWKESSGRYLLTEDPTRGFPTPRERNPKRPVASTDRYEALARVAGQVTTEIRRDSKRIKVATYLPAILAIVAGTGRRISAVLQLQYRDLHLKGRPGAIRWPSGTDKMGREWDVPISPLVRAALDGVLAARPGVGATWLFPSFANASKPVSKELATSWLLRAEALAEVDHLPGGAWHPFRRAWACCRKHLPDVDVAAAGGWSDLQSLKVSYQQPDRATLLRVVTDATELREMKNFG